MARAKRRPSQGGPIVPARFAVSASEAGPRFVVELGDAGITAFIEWCVERAEWARANGVELDPDDHVRPGR